MTEPIASFKCFDIIFDIYNSESVSIESTRKYYVTPKRMAKIEKWMIENNISKIETQEHLDYLIQNNYFGEYAPKPLIRVMS